MEVQTVKNHIKSKTFNKFYIFTGEEVETQKIYINKIVEVGNFECRRIDSVSEIYSTSKSKSLVQRKYCYVVRDDKDFMKSEKAWGNINNVLGSNILILLVTSIDKRGKFYKRFTDDIVEFNYYPENILVRYIQNVSDMSVAHTKKLIEICESDYSRILLELDKIKKYSISKNIKEEDAFRILVEKDVIYMPPKDAIFDYVDSMLRGKINKSYELLEECNKIGEPALRLILVLYNNMKHLLQVQACQSKDVAKTTGLTNWEINGVKDKVGIYTNGELVRILKLLKDVEQGIKTGQIEEPIAMDYVMVNILGGYV